MVPNIYLQKNFILYEGSYCKSSNGKIYNKQNMNLWGKHLLISGIVADFFRCGIHLSYNANVLLLQESQQALSFTTLLEQTSRPFSGLYSTGR